MSAGLVVTLTILVVIAINILIVISVKRRKYTSTNKYKVINDFSKQIRDPFQKEDKAMKDLSNLIEKIQEEVKSENNLE